MIIIQCIITFYLNIIYCYASLDDIHNHHKAYNKRVKKSLHSIHHHDSNRNHSINYGVTLPSFSYDYSEYFTGAIIERSSDNPSSDLYLTMFLVGHDTISINYPFEAINTEEETMHQWTQATKKWKESRHSSNIKDNYDKHYNKNSPAFQAISSGLYCLTHYNDHHIRNSNTKLASNNNTTNNTTDSSYMHSNVTKDSVLWNQTTNSTIKQKSKKKNQKKKDIKIIKDTIKPQKPYRPQVYRSPIYFYNIYHSHDHSNNNNSETEVFIILRCKLRNVYPIIKNAISYEDQIKSTYLFVDVMRHHALLTTKKQQQKQFKNKRIMKSIQNIDHPNNKKNNTTSRRYSPTSTTNQQYKQQAIDVLALKSAAMLISFHIPWSTRMIGYGMQQHSNTTNLNPWYFQNLRSSSDYTDTTATDVIKSNRNNYDLSMTLELNQKSLLLKDKIQSEFHLCVGGIRPLHNIRPEVGIPMLLEFIEHHLLLGFDHIYLGVMVDWKSPYMSKLLHVLQPYISLTQVSIYSTTMPGYDDIPGFNGLQLHDNYAKQFFYHQCLYYSKGIAKYLAILQINQLIIPTDLHSNFKTFYKNPNFLNKLRYVFKQDQKSCSYVFPNSYGFIDPIEGKYKLIHNWGPGENVWRRDYYSQSEAYELQYNSNNSVVFLNTKEVYGIDVSPMNKITPLCFRGVNHDDYDYNTYGQINSIITKHSNRLQSKIDKDVANIFIYQSNIHNVFTKQYKSNLTMNSMYDKIWLKLQASYTLINHMIEDHLKTRNISTILELKNDIKNTKNLSISPILSSISSNISTTTTTTTTISSSYNDIYPPNRNNIKDPYWKQCNIDSLYDVIKNVFE